MQVMGLYCLNQQKKNSKGQMGTYKMRWGYSCPPFDSHMHCVYNHNHTLFIKRGNHQGHADLVTCKFEHIRRLLSISTRQETFSLRCDGVAQDTSVTTVPDYSLRGNLRVPKEEVSVR